MIGGKIVKKHKESGLYYRKNTSDRFVIDEVKMYKLLYALMKDKVVLDLGANIGSFAHMALQSGAKKVYSFEPDSENCEVYRKQYHFVEGKSKLYEAAVKKESGVAYLSANMKSDRVCQTTFREIRGREMIEVKAIGFESILKKLKPQIVKIDIEGEEFNLDLKLLNKYNVEAIAIEIHTNHDRKKAIKTMAQLQQQFKMINNGKITNWSATMFFGVQNKK